MYSTLNQNFKYRSCIVGSIFNAITKPNETLPTLIINKPT